MKKNLLKAAISFGLLAVILSRTNWADIAKVLKFASPGLILLALSLNILMVAVNFLRWDAILKGYGIIIGKGRLFTYYATGVFFNNFLPGSVGGDFYRTIDLSRYTGEKTKAISSIIIDRLAGLMVLLPLTILMVPFYFKQVKDSSLLLASEAGIVFIFFMGFLLFREKNLKFFSFMYNPVFYALNKFELKNKLKELYSSLNNFFSSRILYPVLLLSLLSRILWIAGAYAVARSFKMEVSFEECLLLLPLVELVRTIPVSINGLGVREAAFVLYFSILGLSVSQSVLLSLTIYLLLLFIGLVGGVVYFLRIWKRQNSISTNISS